MSMPFKFEKAVLKTSPSSGGGMLGDMAVGAAASVAGVSGMMGGQWDRSELHFKFNPEKMTLSKTATFKEQPRPSSQVNPDHTPPPPQFVGSTNRTLSFAVLLDEWDAIQGRDVGEMVSTLQRYMDPSTDQPSDEVPLPPRMSFHWGSFIFTGYITKADAVFTMFRQNGSPARAEVDVQMTEHIDTPTAQNPTSGGPSGRRTRLVREGDSLALIAYREYGSSNGWRAIAEANGIDDPFRLEPGRELLVPSRDEARRLA